MKAILAIFIVMFVFPFDSVSQTERRPKYAPRKDKHRNKRDELDRKQGLWKHYNYLGTLMWEIEYLDDRKHGITKQYYGNGRLMRETEYNYGIKDGMYKRYGYDVLMTEGEYSEGKKQNLWTNYYSNGQIRNTGMYNKGLKEGEWKYYNRKGQVINTIQFKGGRNVLDIQAAEKKAAEEKRQAELRKKNKERDIYRTPK